MAMVYLTRATVRWAAYAGCGQHHVFQHRHVGIEVFGVGAIREAGTDQRTLQTPSIADANAPVFEVRAVAELGDVR